MGWKESKLERAFFLLFDGMELVGLVGCHVDDWFAAGNIENKVYCKSIEKLSKLRLLTSEQPPFRYCEKQVEQTADFTINVSTAECCTSIEEVKLDAARRRRPTERATVGEKETFEPALGALGWLPRQLRMDVAFGYSLLRSARKWQQWNM